MKKSSSIMAFVVAVLLLTVGYASAITYEFASITNTNAVDAAIGEAQLRMDVTDLGSNQVYFKFTNTGPAASSITDIYFEDNVPFLLTYYSFTNSAGVSFGVGANPPNLPGGQNPLYHFSSNYAYDSNSPVQPNGINPNESLGITFDLTGANQFADIISALDGASLRVGLHVQGFASGGSESYIDSTPVPEPGTIMLLGMGLFGLTIFGKRRVNKVA